MESDGSADSLSDFGFAFNDVNFSDRILRIEIIPGSKPDPNNNSLSEWARNRKRRRDDDFIDLTVKREEQILNCNMPDLEDGATEENQDEAVAMIEEPSQPGNEDSMDYSAIEVKTINISSPILAAKSPFFYKLFSSNKRERDQRHITLQIQESEEAALMDLLIFMYSNTLSRTTPPALLDVLMAADKYEVASCMRYCSQLLRNLPMTCESALLYLDLPSTVSMADTVLPLTDAAKEFFAARFKDISKFQEEVLNLPLAGIEAVLVSDDLQVVSEDAVYDFVMKWARKHYPKSEVRRQILNKHLLQYVRFPCMSSRKLRKVLTCPDIDRELSSKFVLDALFFKSETPHRQRSIISEEPNPTSRCFVERAYKYRPVKAIEFGKPREQCVVYLDLKREECANLFPAGRVYSQVFYLGGQGFFLSGHCNLDQYSEFRCFGLFLGMQEKGSVGFTVEYEFSSRTKPEEEFVSKYKGNYTFSGGKAVGYRNLFSTPWCAFISDASPYFINGMLHLRAELTIKK